MERMGGRDTLLAQMYAAMATRRNDTVDLALRSYGARPRLPAACSFPQSACHLPGRACPLSTFAEAVGGQGLDVLTVDGRCRTLTGQWCGACPDGKCWTVNAGQPGRRKVI